MSDRKPIVIVYCIASLELGGAEKQLYLLLRGLDKKIYTLNVITFYDGFWVKQIEALDIPVMVISHRFKIFMFFHIYTLIKKIRPEIVHTIGATAGYWGRTAAILSGVRTIIASERNAVHIKSFLKRLAERFLMKYTQKIICNAYHSAAYYIKNGYCKSEKVTVLHNGIDLRDYPLLDPLRNKISIGYIANFKPQKNHKMLIEAAALLVSDYPRIEVHFAGSGEMREQTENFIRERGLQKNIVLHGKVRNVQAFLRSINMYVHTSSYEGLSNAIMEAMASGLPCIVTKTEGNTELIEDHENGLLVEPGDSSSLASRIKYLVDSPFLMRTFGINARTTIECSFGVKRMIRQTDQIYQNKLKDASSQNQRKTR